MSRSMTPSVHAHNSNSGTYVAHDEEIHHGKLLLQPAPHEQRTGGVWLMRRVAQRRPPPLPLAGQRPNPRPRRRTATSTCPIPGDGSDIMFHLRSRPPWKVLHGSHWTIGNQTAPVYWPSHRYQHRDAGRYYTFGQCAAHSGLQVYGVLIR